MLWVHDAMYHGLHNAVNYVEAVGVTEDVRLCSVSAACTVKLSCTLSHAGLVFSK